MLAQHNREALGRAPHPPPQQSRLGYLHALELTGATAAGMQYGRNLGPAGEQFIQQTPWANPEHPAHHQGHVVQQARPPARAPSRPQPALPQSKYNRLSIVPTPAPASASVPSAAPANVAAAASSSSLMARIHPGHPESASAPPAAHLTNGDSAPLHMQKPHPAAGRDTVGAGASSSSHKSPHLLGGPSPAQAVIKHEGVAQVS